MKDADAEESEFIDEEEAENSAASLKKLRERLAKAIEEKQEYLDGWQRARAEFANYKKQEQTFSAERGARAKAELIESLLPALDALELAAKHAPADATLKMLWKQFLNSLANVGVDRIGTEGEKFDPNNHEPLREVAAESQNLDHTIFKVERSGYAAGDTIIRPAHVVVQVFKN